MRISQMHSCHFYWDRRVPLAQRCTGEPNQQLQQDIFHSVSHPWNNKSKFSKSQFKIQHEFTKLIFLSGMKRIPHVPMVILRWFLWFPCHWLFDLWLFNSRSCAGRHIGINRTTFQQLHLLKLWRAFIAQVGCPVVIKQMVMKFNWIVDNTKVFWLGLSTYFRFFNGRHPSMLRVLPPLDHVTAEITFDAHSIHHCIAYFCMHHWSISVEYLTLWWLRDHFQLEGASRATTKEPSIHADTRIRSCRRTGIGFQVHHLWRWICE